MITRQKWTEHKFPFGIDVGWTPNIVTRVQDTVIRLHHHCDRLTPEDLTHQPDGGWSIQEHIGHIIDLEELHYGRLLQFEAMNKELAPADMSNTKTEAADHNARQLVDLLQALEIHRNKFLEKYKSFSTEQHNHSAFHPRLKINMKPVDMLFFMAEHDDHHITTILSIRNTL